jgi:hypothetical protein
MSMPIHAVTEVYGTEGLRARLGFELEFLDGGGQALVARADRVATRLHADDLRVREPYVNHLLRCTIRIVHYYRVRDAEVIAAMWLHDSVEDHPSELADFATAAQRAAGETKAALAVVRRAFTPRVASLVRSVTNPEYAPDRSHHEQYREHVIASLERDPWARVLKLSDFTDNGLGIIHAPGPIVLKLTRKYAPLVPHLRDFANRHDTPLDQEAKVHITQQIGHGEERFRAILADAAEAAAAADDDGGSGDGDEGADER